MKILLDTNILPRYGKIENVMISTVLRVAAAVGARVAITSTVFDESVNARRQAVDTAIEQHNKAVSNLSKYWPIEPYYVPPLELVVADWEEQLRSLFEVIELGGEDAVEALIREANRVKPAKGNGTGARDAAIWLCIKRAHLLEDSTTHFVSANTEDFANPKEKSNLHPDLEGELGDRCGDFIYHTSLDCLLSSLCSPASIEISSSSFPEEVLISVVEQIVEHEDLQKFADFSHRSPNEFGPVESIGFSNIRVKSSYAAEGTIVGFISATFHMPLAGGDVETPGNSVSGQLGGWIEVPSSEFVQIEVFDITHIKEIKYDT